MSLSFYLEQAAPLILVYAAGFFLASGATRLSIRLALARGIVALPNRRTSHSGAVPRIGGIGIATVWFTALAACAAWRVWAAAGGRDPLAAPGARWLHLEPALLWPALLGGASAFLLGLWDDARGLGATPKLIFQIPIAALPALWGIGVAGLSLPAVGEWRPPALLAAALGTLWILFWMNAYNFMDGINGIAARFAETVCLALLALTFRAKWNAEPLLIVCLAGACAGFLRWNAPTARTFMGDCGSQSLGFLFALLTLFLPISSRDLWVNTSTGAPVGERAYPLIAMFLVLLPFGWDVVWTLARRVLRGENLLQAHRSHLYQRLTSTGLTHAQTVRVCLWTFYACAACGALMARFTPPERTALRWAWVICALGVMAAYTAYVHWREKRCAAAQKSPG